jgi:hypothetical protein
MELCVCVWGGGGGGGLWVGACKREKLTSQSELKICTRALIRGVAEQVLDQRLALRSMDKRHAHRVRDTGQGAHETALMVYVGIRFVV